MSTFVREIVESMYVSVGPLGKTSVIFTPTHISVGTHHYDPADFRAILKAYDEKHPLIVKRSP